MIDGNYLRRQAETCLLLSRSTFDLTVASRLRALAAEFRTKADAADDEGHGVLPHIIKRRRSPQGDRRE